MVPARWTSGTVCRGTGTGVREWFLPGGPVRRCVREWFLPGGPVGWWVQGTSEAREWLKSATNSNYNLEVVTTSKVNERADKHSNGEQASLAQL